VGGDNIPLLQDSVSPIQEKTHINKEILQRNHYENMFTLGDTSKFADLKKREKFLFDQRKKHLCITKRFAFLF